MKRETQNHSRYTGDKPQGQKRTKKKARPNGTGTPQQTSRPAEPISRKTKSAPTHHYRARQTRQAEGIPLPGFSIYSHPHPRTDSKNMMPTKLCPRKSGTVFGPNAQVRRAQRDAEAVQYLQASSQNESPVKSWRPSWRGRDGVRTICAKHMYETLEAATSGWALLLHPRHGHRRARPRSHASEEKQGRGKTALRSSQSSPEHLVVVEGEIPVAQAVHLQPPSADQAPSHAPRQEGVERLSKPGGRTTSTNRPTATVLAPAGIICSPVEGEAAQRRRQMFSMLS